MPKIPDFVDVLEAEMARAGLSVKQLAQRLGIHPNGVEKILARRANAGADRQAKWLAACRMPAHNVASLMAAFEADMVARIAVLTTDIETVLSEQRQPNKAEALVSAAKSAGSPDRPVGRVAARRPGAR